MLDLFIICASWKSEEEEEEEDASTYWHYEEIAENAGFVSKVGLVDPRGCIEQQPASHIHN
jgi:hypothetical protein